MLLSLSLNVRSSFAADAASPKLISTNPNIGLKNESEAGIIVTSGNAKTQSYNLRQMNEVSISSNLLRFTGKYLQTRNNGLEAARQWNLGLRFERELSVRWAAYLGQSLDSDIFAGYFQRYNSDIGGKFYIYKLERFEWISEVGYRFTHENRRDGSEKNYHYGRIYTEATRGWNENVSSKIFVEYLPNFSESKDWLLNGEVSTSALLNSIFSVKVAYGLRYRNLPPPTAIAKTDNTVTMALVAKY